MNISKILKCDVRMSHLYGIIILVMIMQINRLFEIIYILLHKKKVSATELATHLGVSRRTICRDIAITVMPTANLSPNRL